MISDPRTPATTLSCSCRVLQPSDADQVRTLFQEVFREEMSEALWRWKYAREDSKGVVVFRAGRMVAHYGGMGRWVLMKGSRQLAVQIGDVMVASAVRQSVRRRSPFYLAFTTFAEHYLGHGKLFPFAFGFPNDRAFQLAERLGFYAKVGSMSEVTWLARCLPRWRSCRFRWELLDEAALLRRKSEVMSLWLAMARDLAEEVLGVRDVDWLRHRYFRRPDNRYQVGVLSDRLLRKQRAILVVEERDRQLFLLDLVAPMADLPLCASWLSHLAAVSGKESVQSWCTVQHAEKFRDTGALVNELPITIPANIWTQGPPLEELNDHWWLMPGDTDFL